MPGTVCASQTVPGRTSLQTPLVAYNPAQSPMTFSAGAKLGTYEIVGPPGARGMGEVYRARDSRLKREVPVWAPDGRRIVFTSQRDKRDKVVFVFNFFDELRRIAPVGRKLFQNSIQSIGKFVEDAVESGTYFTHQLAEFLARLFVPLLRCSVFVFVLVEAAALTF